jgi:hypothetical protein
MKDLKMKLEELPNMALIKQHKVLIIKILFMIEILIKFKLKSMNQKIIIKYKIILAIGSPR